MISSVRALLLLTLTAATADGQVPGNRIVANDGDIIVVQGTAKVRVIRRIDATVRTIYNPAEQWLVVLVDVPTARGGPDGLVDNSYSFTSVSGNWPMDERWEGTATIEEHSMVGEVGPTEIGVVGPRGLVMLSSPVSRYRDPAAVAVLTFRGSGRGGSRVSFDEAERMQVEQARRNAARQSQLPTGATVSMGMRSGIADPSPGAYPSPEAPVRVGGNIRTPTKIVDVKPVVPETALRAGITGVVIVEATIDKDGSVKEARVLRSIPLLDQAAIDAVRQWRFEPTLLNGQPVPVIMTVTVPFDR